MTPDGLLEVTDLKQYAYCARIPFYRYCLPAIRPVTYGMREGILSHREEQAREERRSLRAYGLVEGERVFDLALRSEELGLVGRLDMAIRCHRTTGEAGATAGEKADAKNEGELVGEDEEAIVVDYKLTQVAAGKHFQLQLAAYALLLEEAWQMPVRRAFIYHIPLRKAEEVRITAPLRRRVRQAVEAVRAMVAAERMPPPPTNRSRCVTCEFRRFCNDVI